MSLDDAVSVDQILMWLTAAILGLVPILLVGIAIVARLYEPALTRLATLQLDSPPNPASPQPPSRRPPFSAVAAACPEPSLGTPIIPGGEKPKQL